MIIDEKVAPKSKGKVMRFLTIIKIKMNGFKPS